MFRENSFPLTRGGEVSTAEPGFECAVSERNVLKSELEQALAARQRGLTKQEKESVPATSRRRNTTFI